ncbi:MAG TPA: endonuclease/exonuclease/phosphatase family protein [Nevskiaceae bacterium]|nr:endonuclease/exonuclease/phosphatase family protein [Nevskiaceae bacterium]
MTIKFVTVNIWHGGTLMDNLLAFLQKQKADVLVLQEVYNGTDPSLPPQYRSMQVLKQKLQYAHEYYQPFYRDFDRSHGKAQNGSAILSTYPILHTDTAFVTGEYSETYRDVPGNYQNCPSGLQHAVLDTPEGSMDVYNIHGVWDMDGDNFSPQRRKMTETILAAITGKQRVLLAGDSNAKTTNKAIIMLEGPLHNVFGQSLPSTFNMRHKDNPGYATAAVDIMFVSSNIKVLAKDCPSVDVSDHLPLTATLEI